MIPFLSFINANQYWHGNSPTTAADPENVPTKNNNAADTTAAAADNAAFLAVDATAADGATTTAAHGVTTAAVADAATTGTASVDATVAAAKTIVISVSPAFRQFSSSSFGQSHTGSMTSPQKKWRCPECEWVNAFANKNCDMCNFVISAQNGKRWDNVDCLPFFFSFFTLTFYIFNIGATSR